MELVYNNGLGAVLCSRCRIIIDQNFDTLMHATYSALADQGIDWFCRTCDPDAAFAQLEIFADEYRLQDIARYPSERPVMLQQDDA